MNKVTQGNSVWYAGIFEVTQAQYFAVMGNNPSNYSGDNRPVEEVSWNDIMDGNNSFMAKINAQLADKLTANGLSGYIFNLPTKAQWEYTCRAGSTGDYSKNAEDSEVTENTLGEYAWYKDNSQNTTHDVGTREPNLWGFYDMHGNVYEWCAELVDGSKRAISGAAFNVPANYCGSSQEFKQTPSYKYFDVGFRVFLMPATYTITLSGCEGATGVDNTSIDYNVETADFVLPQPTKTNYDFVGWIINNGDPATTVTISKGTHENRTYVASWTLASVLTFNLSETVTLEMRKCPAGSFVRSGEGDGNTVTISKDFYMGTFEVTNAQYKALMTTSPSAVNTGDNYPVESIKWSTIMAQDGFIAKLNEKLEDMLPNSGYKFALPTEAQWEYACRAGTDTDLNSGKNIENMNTSAGPANVEDVNTGEVAWYRYNSGNTTHEVGTRGTSVASNSFGLFDMHGNVYEYCSDLYDANYDSNNLTDPTGPVSGTNHVVRGGGYDWYPRNSSSSHREMGNPGTGYKILGFRLAFIQVPMN